MSQPNPATVSSRPRVVVFGSFYRGYYVLNELLTSALKDRVEVVGVVSDDPSQNFISAHKRVWQYPHTEAERLMVRELAERHGLPVYTGKVKSAEFYELIEQQLRPDLCVMATFGQLINARLFNFPRLGFFNLHPCTDDGWPSQFAGGNPFHELLQRQQPYTKIAMHRVDEGLDTGELIAYSEAVAIPAHASVTDLHKITSPTAARLVAQQVSKILDGWGA